MVCFTLTKISEHNPKAPITNFKISCNVVPITNLLNMFGEHCTYDAIPWLWDTPLSRMLKSSACLAMFTPYLAQIESSAPRCPIPMICNTMRRRGTNDKTFMSRINFSSLFYSTTCMMSTLNSKTLVSTTSRMTQLTVRGSHNVCQRPALDPCSFGHQCTGHSGPSTFITIVHMLRANVHFGHRAFDRLGH